MYHINLISNSTILVTVMCVPSDHIGTDDMCQKNLGILRKEKRQHPFDTTI